jgi:glycosyltransferase involved in cell wall biosynthesis
LLPIEIVPNAVAASFWAPDDRASQRPASCDGPTIFTAATVVAPKGIGELVEAVAMLRSRGCPARLVIAGKWGRLGRSLHARLRSRPELATWLRLCGHLPREQLRDHYRSADVVCFPSWWENCPCACLEAMASGAVVLGSSAGGMAEIIRDGRDGFLVPPHEPRILADRLAHLLALTQGERQRLRDSALDRIAASYDVNVVVPRLLACYRRVIDGGVRRHRSARECA